ncbi:MAG TPA: hydroxymethylbilane synthase [Bacteroidia bacterium]|nr:hydroxymethylbilane synthase [Bacteroidia bacterium]
MKKIIIGTRGSDLALWQANYTKGLIEKLGREVELKIISTEGDRSQQWNTGFDKLEGKGFFTKEIEDALLKKEIDLAVHSHKDLPTNSPEGLIIAGVSEREDPCELLLIRQEAVDEKQKFNLKQKAVLGTSSSRRKAQFLAIREDVALKDLRGNVPTRVKKLREGGYDAILIANAGIERLGLDLSGLHVEKLNPKEFTPAPAQGVLAWQIRENDSELENLIARINNEEVQTRINVERRILNLFEGGCHMPLGAYCEFDTDENDKPVFKVWVSKADEWDKQPVQLYFESTLIYDLPEKIVEKIKNIKPQKIFVTKTFRDKDYLPKALKRLGFTVEAKSLIEFKEIEFNIMPVSDWIFFSSKRAVKYFFQQKPNVGKVKFGCISKETASELRQFGHRADFIGQNTDTKFIGKQFSSLAGNAKVLFPVAKESMQSVQMQLTKKENVINLPVYQTIKHPAIIDTSTNIVVFTSPSNVDAFFEKNKWQSTYKAVAMGDATESALARKGVRRCAKPISFDDLGLVQAILSLS